MCISQEIHTHANNEGINITPSRTPLPSFLSVRKPLFFYFFFHRPSNACLPTSFPAPAAAPKSFLATSTGESSSILSSLLDPSTTIPFPAPVPSSAPPPLLVGKLMHPTRVSPLPLLSPKKKKIEGKKTYQHNYALPHAQTHHTPHKNAFRTPYNHTVHSHSPDCPLSLRCVLLGAGF